MKQKAREPEEQPDWITPTEASRRLTERVGFVVTPDDLKQQRRLKKIKNTKKLTSNLALYDGKEIDKLDASFKRVKVPAAEWEQVMQHIDEQRKTRAKIRPQSS